MVGDSPLRHAFERLRRPGPRGLAAAGIVVAIAAAAVALLGGGGDERAAAQDAGTPTVALERRDLVSRESFDGSLGYAGEAEVINRMAGTITWLPAKGDVIGRGERLYAVDGTPVLLLYGDVPAYRDLASGVSDGLDVQQLESNLAALGFDPGTVDREFSSSTASAVSEWQDSLDLVRTGSVELGRVVFLPGARRITSLELSLGSDASSAASAGGGNAAAAATATGGSRTVLAGYVSDPDPSAPEGGGDGADDTEPGDQADGDQGEDSPSGKQPGKDSQKPKQQGQDGANADEPAAPSGQAAAGQPQGGGSSAGDAAAQATNPSVPVLTTSSRRRVVTVELDPGDVSLAKRGQRALVSLPDGKEVKGRISTVGTVAESSSSGTGTEEEATEPTIEVTISLPGGAKVTALDQAPVTVELTDEVRRDVFAVPVEALLGTAGGEYAIVVIDAGGRRQLPVSPGLFADGYVEVEGEGLAEGAEVEVPGE